MKLKISEIMWNELHTELFRHKEVETAGILLGEPIHTPNEVIVLIRQATLVPESGYLTRKLDHISIDPLVLNRMTKPARDKGWSVFTIHTHPMAKEAWFSKADDIGDSRLMPSLHCQIPGMPHGSIVVTDGGDIAARVFDENANSDMVCLQTIGKSIVRSRLNMSNDETWFARQRLALGETGQKQLRNLRVGIIGLGGIGSLVSMQLAHLGVGELVLIDGDIVEASNVSRIVGCTKTDAGKSFKVDVAARYIQYLGLSNHTETYPEHLNNQHESLIASCDAVISCVDKYTPRALLNRWSYKYYVPVIDLGTVFRVDNMGAMISDAGRVVTIGPGKPCLGCWGHLDANAIRIESLSQEDLESEIDDGYIQGADIAQPSVISFNTLVAGSGVTELLRLVTGFAGLDNPPNRLAFSFHDGTVRRNSLTRNLKCSICGGGS